MQVTRRYYPMRFPFLPAEVVSFFRDHYGPTQRAFAALDPGGQRALHRDLTQLWTDHNQACDGSTVVEAEYLEAVASRA